VPQKERGGSRGEWLRGYHASVVGVKESIRTYACKKFFLPAGNSFLTLVEEGRIKVICTASSELYHLPPKITTEKNKERKC